MRAPLLVVVCEKFPASWSGEGTVLREGLGIALAQALEITEAEPLSFEDWTANVAAKLVTLKGRKAAAAAVVEKIVGIEDAVPFEIISDTVITVGARLGDHVDDGARGTTELSVEGLGLDLEFLDGINGRVDAPRLMSVVSGRTLIKISWEPE